MLIGLLAAAPAAVAQEVPPPEEVVAYVGEEPVTKAAFDELFALAGRHEDAPFATRDDVMDYLLEAVWVRQEAAARGIAPTARRIRRRLAREKRAFFDSEREFRRWLRRSGMTMAQILERAESIVLQERIAAQVTSKARPVTREDVDRHIAAHPRLYRGVQGPEGRREARLLIRANRRNRLLERFDERFQSRYRAITVCFEGYVVQPECGATAPSPR